VAGGFIVKALREGRLRTASGGSPASSTLSCFILSEMRDKNLDFVVLKKRWDYARSHATFDIEGVDAPWAADVRHSAACQCSS
jgi:hypothetical protein